MRSAWATVLGAVVCGVAGAAVGCGSSSSGAPAGSADAGVVAPDDAQAADEGDALPNIDQPANVYPAQHQPIPLMVNDPGGRIIASPKVVPITVKTDSRAAYLNSFAASVTTTQWWKTVMSGYGIGAGTAGTPAQLPAFANPSITDDDVRAALQTGVTNGTIPPPTTDTIYTFFFTKDITVTHLSATSCVEFLGYHENADITPPGSNAVNVAYAIVPTCTAYPQDTSQAELDQLTVAASHELAEAASDPTGGQQGGFVLLGDDSWLPSFYPLGALIENGDACSNAYDVNAESYDGDQSGYLLQRIWSNSAAMASDNPCQPTKSGRIYFAAAVKTTKQRGASGAMSYGYVSVKRGTSVNVEVDVFSKAALPHPFLIYVGKDKFGATDPSDMAAPGNNLTIDLSKTTVQNGDGVWMTVTAASNSAVGAYERLVVRSILEKTDYNDWPFIVKVTN